MASLSSASVLAAAVFLIGSVAAIAYVAIHLARRWARNDSLLTALLFVLLCVSQAVGVSLALGMMGVLTRTAVLVGQIVAAVTVRVLTPVTPRSVDETPKRWSITGLAALATGTIVATLATVPTLRGLASTSYDTRDYHIAAIASWLQRHNIWHLPFQNPAFYTATHPSNGEMFGLWLILPTHSDQIAYLAVIPFGALLIFGIASIARDLGGDSRIGALAGVALVAAPVSYTNSAHSLLTDLAATASLVAATALLLRATRSEESHRTALVACAGIALGLALGSKYTALFPGGFVIAWGLIALRPRRALWAFLPGIVFFAAPWFIRNAVLTGNPLFPLDLRFAGVHLLSGGTGPLDSLKTTLAEHVRKGHLAVLKRWVRLAARWYGPAGLLGLAGLWAMVPRDQHRRARLAILGLAVVALIAYAVTPYTGSQGAGALLLELNTRYALIAIALGVALAVSALPIVFSIALTSVALGYDAWKIARGVAFRPELHVGPLEGLAAIALAIALVIGSTRWRRIVDKARAFLAFPARRAAALSASVVIAWVLAALTISHINGVTSSTALEQVLAPYRNLGGPVIVIDVSDVRSVLGPRLDMTIESLQAGRRGRSNPYTKPAGLTAALEASGARILVIPDSSGSLGLPTGWRPPPQWKKVGTAEFAAVYVRET